MTPETATDERFASDQARELAAANPDVELPKRGSGTGGKLTIGDVRKRIPEETTTSESKAAPSSKTPRFGSKGYSGSQPWEKGGPDVVIDHGRPMLSSGSDGPSVDELGALLAELDYETTLSRGENHFAILDASVLNAVQAFRRDYGVREDPAGFPTATDADNHVGPVTWEALLSAVD